MQTLFYRKAKIGAAGPRGNRKCNWLPTIIIIYLQTHFHLKSTCNVSSIAPWNKSQELGRSSWMQSTLANLLTVPVTQQSRMQSYRTLKQQEEAHVSTGSPRYISLWFCIFLDICQFYMSSKSWNMFLYPWTCISRN